MKKSVNIINNRYFEGIEKFLRYNFETYEIISTIFEDGKCRDYDGIKGYSIKPSLEIIIKANQEKYKFNFYLDSNYIGNYWWWEITKTKSTRYFESFSEEQIIKGVEQYKYILKNYIIN